MTSSTPISRWSIRTRRRRNKRLLEPLTHPEMNTPRDPHVDTRPLSGGPDNVGSLGKLAFQSSVILSEVPSGLGRSRRTSVQARMARSLQNRVTPEKCAHRSFDSVSSRQRDEAPLRMTEFLSNPEGVAMKSFSNPERVASTQPRVGAAAPTLGSFPLGSNPVRVGSARPPLGTAAATTDAEGNGVARTSAFPSATWERGEETHPEIPEGFCNPSRWLSPPRAITTGSPPLAALPRRGSTAK